MGYTTEFTGSVTIDPPLNEHELAYLARFNHTRRMDRERGPYFVEGSDGAYGHGQGDDADITRYNDPDPTQPSLWCGWVPTTDGAEIVWDGVEKFYGSADWMVYLIDHFLKPDAHAKTYTGPHRPDAFDHFTFNHTINGRIRAEGEDANDRWTLIVTDNHVAVADAD